MSTRIWHSKDILNINVSGKRYTVCRAELLADPHSILAKWFKTGTPSITDKNGNIYLSRDSKIFRHILSYLRFKKEGVSIALALPSNVDELAKLVGECEALNLKELKELALSMLNNFLQKEEQHYTATYVQQTIKQFKAWKFEQEQSLSIKVNCTPTKPINNDAKQQINDYNDWD